MEIGGSSDFNHCWQAGGGRDGGGSTGGERRGGPGRSHGRVQGRSPGRGLGGRRLPICEDKERNDKSKKKKPVSLNSPFPILAKTLSKILFHYF